MPKFQSFWFGEYLPPYQLLAMKSFVDFGHEYVLYSYRKFDVPAGVELRDGNDILPEASVFFYGERAEVGRGSISAFSNLFRYHLLHQLGGWWVDADVVCLSENVPSSEIFMGWEYEDLIGTAILKFPQGHAFVRELRDTAERAGTDLEWGATGPFLLTRLVKERNVVDLVSPQPLSYPVQSRDAVHLLIPDRRDEIQKLIANSPFLHVWNEVLRRAVVFTWMAPPPGSLMAELFERHGIGFHNAPIYTAEEVQRLNDNYCTSMRWEWERKSILLRESRLATEKAEADQLRAELTQAKSQGDQLRAELTQTKSQGGQFLAELTQSKSQRDQLQLDLSQTSAESEHLRAELSRLSAVHNETLATISWRITEPLRWVRARFPATAQFGRAMLRFVWRSATFQLLHRPQLPPSKILDRKSPLDISALELPASPSTPLVSILIPVYNQLEFTLRCLKSIQDNPSKASAEVIVLDDASKDETSNIVAKIPGVRYIRNEHNLGFLRSCNRAASEARGKYLVFLNNDTEVQKDWLDRMLATFERSGPVGLVGAKLIYPDGRLQEAGGMIWRDASGLNFGRDDDPQKPEYNYVREADYCSGACIAVRASLFHQLNGFDELFAPAYYEDTDLAFRIRDRGYKVLYQPAAQIIHFEGGTCGTDLESGIKSYQRVNAKKFAEKWAKTLAQHYPPDNPNLLLARDRGAVARCLLVDVWPRPDHDSGSIDLINLVKLLQSLSYKVSFFPFNTTRHFGQYTEDLQQMGVECLYEPFVTNLAKYLEVNGRHLDLVVLRRAPCAISHFDLVRANCPKAKVIFETVDLHFLREQRAALLKNSGLEKAEELKRSELDIIKRADCTLVVSEAEASLLEEEIPEARVHLFPFVREIPGRMANFETRRNIAFIGGYLHEPNVDAVRYFVSEIWPQIAKRLPDVQFLMVGSDMPRALYRLADDRIKAIGYVGDLTSLLKSCRLTVAPLRYGAGIKGKIATSFANGVPVVASPIAVEGMGCEQEVHLLVAETTAQWADCVTRAYTDEKLWRQLSDNGLTLMHDSFSIEAGLQRLHSLLARLELPLPEAASQSREETPSLRIEPSPVGTANVQFVSGVDLQPRIQKPKTDVRAIAFYLPQYHPIPENDGWWGKGFTEWTNVTRGRPLFRGHYQPHLPGELGFYDLRLQEVREAQADLARKHGLYGFCYHYYWFAGKRVLERPLAEMLASGRPNFPFCISWANENWTRRWDGRDQEILLKQEYSAEGDLAFIQELIPVLSDQRYIRVNGKPLLLVYRTESMPNSRKTAEIWREEAVKAGIGDLYLCRVESFSAIDPKKIGFDAACQFPPLIMDSPEVDPRLILSSSEASEFKGRIFDYGGMVRKALSAKVHYKRFLGITPSWDNTPRRGQHGAIWLNSPPEEYEKWLIRIREDTMRLHEGHERLIFINAWNEWAEGCHLEPDQRYGRAFLQATQRALCVFDHPQAGSYITENGALCG